MFHVCTQIDLVLRKTQKFRHAEPKMSRFDVWYMCISVSAVMIESFRYVLEHSIDLHGTLPVNSARWLRVGGAQCLESTIYF